MVKEAVVHVSSENSCFRHIPVVAGLVVALRISGADVPKRTLLALVCCCKILCVPDKLPNESYSGYFYESTRSVRHFVSLPDGRR
jgi:hypothetical protein